MPRRHISVYDLRSRLHWWSYLEYIVSERAPPELELLVVNSISANYDLRQPIYAYLDRGPPLMQRLLRDRIPAYVITRARERWNRIMPSWHHIDWSGPEDPVV